MIPSFPRLLFIGLLWLVAALPALARDHVTARAWVEDPTGQMSLEQVQALPAQPFTGVLARGYGRSVLWIRLRLDPGAGAAPGVPAQPLALRIRPVYLDDIQLHDPQGPSPAAGATGDRHHPRLDLLQGRDFLLPIAPGAQPRDLWLRVVSTSTRQLHVEALSLDELGRVQLQESLVASLYVGIVMVMVAWGLASWAVTREPLLAAFAIKQAAALLFALSSLGFLRAFWPTAWPATALDGLASAFSVLAVGAALHFHLRFLADFRPARSCLRVLQAMLAACAVSLVLLAVGEPIAALQANMAVIVVSAVAAPACVMSSRAWSPIGPARPPALPRWLVLGFYLLILAFMLAASLPGLALAQGSIATVYVSQIHGLVTGVLVLLMLQYRNHIQRRQQSEALMALERATLQARHERQAREDREQLLAMLAHEIKTPLATMHMRLDASAPGSREIRQAIADMNGVIERCLQAVQLGEGQLQARLQPHDVVDIVGDAVAACAHPSRVRLEAPAALVAHTDRQLLFIILCNLLDNACKYSPADSPIRLAVEARPGVPRHGMVRLTLDNLPGVAGRPDPARVFSKYYRAPHAKRQAGTGLGLYLVRNLAQRLGGGVLLEADPAAVRFVLHLPSAAPPCPAASPA